MKRLDPPQKVLLRIPDMMAIYCFIQIQNNHLQVQSCKDDNQALMHENKGGFFEGLQVEYSGVQ